jgi:DNA ligase-1
MHNMNDAETSQLGLQKRSHHQANKVPSGKLGALICKPITPSITRPDLPGFVGEASFKIGTGFDDATRHLLWAQRDELFGKIVKYKSMLHGTLDAPRHPVFLGFRAEDFS